MLKSLVLEILHTNREQRSISFLLVIEKNTLSFGHVSRSICHFRFFPVGAILVEEIKQGIDHLLGFSSLGGHQQRTLRLVKPQIQLMMRSTTKHPARHFEPFDGTLERLTESRGRLI